MNVKIIYKTNKKDLNKVQDDDCWDFSLEDVLNGAIELQDGMTYYLIGSRLYETTL